jgi:hypothetical protein
VVSLFRAYYCDYAEVTDSTDERIWLVLEKHKFERQQAYYDLAGVLDM